MERAIRSALDKGDPGDAEFRKRIYRSALNALERSIAGGTGMASDEAYDRREHLRNVIRHVETEFRPAEEPQAHDGGQSNGYAPDVTGHSGHQGRVEMPEWQQTITPQSRGERVVDSNPYREAGAGAAAEPAVPKRRENRIIGLPFFVGSAILVGVAAFLYSKYGADVTPPRPGAAQTADTTAPLPGSAEADSREWIDIFSAADPSRVTASAGVGLEVVGEDADKYLRVTTKGSKSETIEFEIGAGVLRQLAGKTVVFDIAARGQEGKTSQIAVQCDLGALGGCGRHRYEVQFQPFNYLLEIPVPEGSADAAGKLLLTPDAAGSGGHIDIREIRVTTAGAAEGS